MQGLNNQESYQKFKTVIPSISIRDLILTMKVIRSLKPAFLSIPIPNPAVLHSTELYKAESLRATSAEVSPEKGADSTVAGSPFADHRSKAEQTKIILLTS